MPFPEPYASLVIRYSYLWKREHEAGREEGTKDRPCAVVMAIMDQDGEWEVLVLPITHSPPPDRRPVPGGDAATIAYGPTPPRFLAQVRDKFLERDQSEKSTRVQRTE